ncbi:MAG: DUF2027 domain-containing protein [Tannerellaceae bacterium]|jgi:hypothetical protein|nr:DUF2027 domain-containing protein [Tannerellaceae bacterium]
MQIKTGDTVRFLNNVGGGIVRSILKNGHVMVETSDGFEIPSLARELVVVDSLDSQTRPLRPHPTPPPVQAPQPKPEPSKETIKIIETSEGEILNVSLAFLPLEAKKLGEAYETYLINESNYFLYINYMSRLNNTWVSRYDGLMEPHVKVFVEEFAREEINALERICVQIIAFKKNKPYMFKDAISAELRIDLSKFYKLHYFTENDYFDDNALICPLVRADRPERELVIRPDDIREAMQQKSNSNSPQQSKPRKKIEEPIVEIDLHINQLLDNTNGMNNADILNYQLKIFHKVLAEYAGQQGRKIVFIHGKGEGVLRSSIEKELRHKYKHLAFQDASFREYGFGATMVTIK